MSGPPKVRSMNVADSEVRPVLGPAGNKARSFPARKPASKPLRYVETTEFVALCTKDAAEDTKTKTPSPAVASPLPTPSPRASSVLRIQEQLLHSNLSLNASCSSEASSDSMYSRASTGRFSQRNLRIRRKQSGPKSGKVVTVSASPLSLQDKKRCAWVTPNTDPCYAAFHDEEWGVPMHNDKKLFELLVLSGALAELTWPTILSKRHIFREVFADFDPAAVAKLNEKKIVSPGSTASSLLSEPKLRAIIENARQIIKIVAEFGSFDNYCWSFVNHKPIENRFRYPRQVPVKTPKADVISKDLVRRGFRSVGPTVLYSFMQAAGLTNDHLITCYRFSECVTAADAEDSNRNCNGNVNSSSKAGKVEEMGEEMGLAKAVGELSIAQ